MPTLPLRLGDDFLNCSLISVEKLTHYTPGRCIKDANSSFFIQFQIDEFDTSNVLKSTSNQLPLVKENFYNARLWSVLVFMKFVHFSFELKETGSSGATESEV